MHHLFRMLYSDLQPSFTKFVRAVLVLNLVVTIVQTTLNFSLFWLIFNAVSLVILVAIDALKQRLSFVVRNYCLFLWGMSLGFTSIVYGSFSGSGIIILIGANFMMFTFLEPKHGKWALVMSLTTYTIIAIFVANDSFSFMRTAGEIDTWLVNGIDLAFMLIASYYLITQLKARLIVTIEQLEAQVETLEQKDAEITELAFYDQLTKLPNRYYFAQLVEERIATRPTAALFIVHVHDVSTIHSTFGMAYGDELLRTISGLLQQEVPLVSRISSHDFAGWLEGESVANIQERMKQLYDKFEKGFSSETLTFKPHLHIAYALYPQHGTTFEQCYKRATVAINQQSHALARFNEQMENDIARRVRLRALLEQAMKGDEFYMVYQAKINVHTRTVTSVEALARWESSELGFISPLEFIPEIDQAHLTAKFGQIVLHNVCRDAKALIMKYGPQLKIAINISPLFFLEKNFVAVVSDALRQYGLPASLFILEITEDIFISDFDTIQTTIAELKQLGVHISLDDFGSGYSSFFYLQNLNLDELKIDKSIIDSILSDERTFLMIQSIVNIARSYHYQIVAEGVETEEQLHRLTEAGVDEVQGYLFSRPERI